MRRRIEYFLDLSDLDPRSSAGTVAQVHSRAVESTDLSALAGLMIESYRGTIDDEGETLEDAVGEIEAYLAGERGGQPLLSESRLAFVDSVLVGACLAGDWDERQLPFIVYVMTHAEWKNRGVGKELLLAVLQAIRDRGHREVRAVITEGNTPSEILFGRVGFREVGIA